MADKFTFGLKYGEGGFISELKRAVVKLPEQANSDKFKGRGQTIDVSKIKELKIKGLGATAIAKEMNIDRTSVYRLLKVAS